MILVAWRKDALLARAFVFVHPSKPLNDIPLPVSVAQISRAIELNCAIDTPLGSWQVGFCKKRALKSLA